MSLVLFFGTCLTVLVCIIGDKLCSSSILHGRRGDTIRAIIDNLTHGIVGGLSWWLLVGFKQNSIGFFNSSRINQSLFCSVLASVIDIDHFIAAGSINIEDVAKLPHRPPMHCSALCLLLCLFAWILSWFYPGMVLLPWEWLIAFSSHHVRDATRRGLWIIPWILTTKPLPYYLYLTLIAAIPPFISMFVPRLHIIPELTTVSKILNV